MPTDPEREPSPRDEDPRDEGATTAGFLRVTTSSLALPIGLRDLLPPVAARRRALARAVLEHFARFGYELVTPPAFEREDVVTRGLGPAARRDLVRFLEPDTGDVVALRPDVTPQIARLAATRYRHQHGPLRFMYEASVVRRPRGRARPHRQVAQAGVECIGWADSSADVEVIRATLGALDALGLGATRVELAHAGIAEALLRAVPHESLELVSEALAARDTAMLARLLGRSTQSYEAMARALALTGDATVLAEAERSLVDETYRAPLAALRAVVTALDACGLGSRVLIDLGAVRGLGYYTGTAFALLSPAAGEPLGAGGRYDTLLARYGADRPATGAALDLELVATALERTRGGAAHEPSRRVLLVGARASERTPRADQLRAQGWLVAEFDDLAQLDPRPQLGQRALAGYDQVLVCNDAGLFALDEAGALAPYETDRADALHRSAR